MVRRIPIRAKVAGALALPLGGLVVAALLGVSSATSAGREVTRQTSLVSASLGHAGLIEALQDERNLALGEMLGLAGGLDLGVDTASARDATDAASTALRRSIAGESDELRRDYVEALGTLEDLVGARATVDAAAASPGVGYRESAHQVFAAYTGVLTTLSEAHDRYSFVVDDPMLRQGDALVHQGAHATDAAARLAERLIYLGSGPGGVDQPADLVEIAELRRDLVQANTAIETRARGAFSEVAGGLDDDPRIAGLPQLAMAATSDPGPVDPRGVLTVTPIGPEGGYAELRNEVIELLDERATELATEADEQRRIYAAAALGLVGMALLVAWWVSRSITRPLHDLSVDARALATHRLPAAVDDILATPAGQDIEVPEVGPVRTRASDEVGDVAAALDDVNQSALGLAAEQAALRRNVAESFVNLGRRNQNLLRRLIDLISDLERDEPGPARLVKLQRLDHLATRVRRNADSLLVLSGAEPEASWQPPSHVSDVVRAALGEVENYERVVVRTLDPVLVIGSGTGDLAHLLAELIENGLRHSPPRELVEVAGTRTPAGYTLTIVDHGLGMTPDEIEHANRRLAGEESVAVTPARYLGHYVTAVLAARHGIRVRLRGSVVVGIAAIVEVPPDLVTDQLPALPAASVPSQLPPAAGPPEASLPPWRRGPVDVEVVEPEVLRRPVRGPTVISLTESESSGDRSAGVAGASNGAPNGAAQPAAGAGRTASGLVRRVRGANAPTGTSGTLGRQSAPDASALPDEASSNPADGTRILQFLTDLEGGVQRSLDEQGPTERGDEE